jgi:hypothetical protein
LTGRSSTPRLRDSNAGLWNTGSPAFAGDDVRSLHKLPGTGQPAYDFSEFSLDYSVNQNYSPTQPVPSGRGRYAIVTERRRGLRWTLAASELELRTKRSQRTAKSCGPGAATLALRWRGILCAGYGGKKGRSPGRARISRKAIARGRPGCLGCTCKTVCFPSPLLAHGSLRVHPAPGFPCALCPREGQRDGKPRAIHAAGMMPLTLKLFEKSNPQTPCRPGDPSPPRLRRGFAPGAPKL